MSTDLKLGVVGGRRGIVARAALGTHDGRVQITAVCDLSEDVLAGWQEEHPAITSFTRYDEFLDKADVDAIFLATPAPLHAPQAIQALQAGKHVLSEVPSVQTLQEGWDLIGAVEASGLTYMMAENYCYMRPNMMVKHMVEEGVFGQITHAEGAYIHDCCQLAFDADGSLTWRADMSRTWNGNRYPTHSLGPVSQWLRINEPDGDRLVSTASWASPPLSKARYAQRNLGADHPGAQAEFWTNGDSVTTVIQTAKGAVIVLRYDVVSSRPHNMTHYVLQGTTASYLSGRYRGEDPLVWIEGLSGAEEDGTATEWDSLWKHTERYEHPRWREWGQEAARWGHGGGDYFVMEDLVNAVLDSTPPPIDVYDAVTWSAIIPLSVESVAKGGVPVSVPGFAGERSGV